MRVSVVPQFDNLDPDFTCAENLQRVATTSASPADMHARQRCSPLPDLRPKASARIQDLSGGMKRRLTSPARWSSSPVR